MKRKVKVLQTKSLNENIDHSSISYILSQQVIYRKTVPKKLFLPEFHFLIGRFAPI